MKENIIAWLTIALIWLIICPALVISNGFRKSVVDCKYMVKLVLEDTQSGQDEPW